MELTPRGILTESTEEKSLFNITGRVEGILRRKSVLRRYNNDHELVVDITQNVFGGPNLRRRSLSLPKVGDLTLANMSSDPSFEGDEDIEEEKKEMVTPTHVCGEGVLLKISPEVEALDLHGITEVLKCPKRRLSPGIMTPIARINKRMVKDENSPLLRERKINWLDHGYEFHMSNVAGLVKEEQTNIISSPGRNKAIARRRLNTLASSDARKEPKVLVKEADTVGEKAVGVKGRKNVVGNLIMKEEVDHDKNKKKKRTGRDPIPRREAAGNRRSKVLKGQQSIANFLSPKTARGRSTEDEQ